MTRSKMIPNKMFRGIWRGARRAITAFGYPILLDYPLNLTERYGYGKPPHAKLFSLIKSFDGNFRATLEACRLLQTSLDRIAISSSDLNPEWNNVWFSGLDAAVLYAILVQNKPSQFVEIGSGNSTRFAKRAIRDHTLHTQIVSIDPAPRVAI